MSERRNQNGPVPRKRARAGHILFLLIAVICTFLLAWWQWTRFRSGSGTFQNLGYALQWPLFGVALVYAYRKYLEYENDMIDARNSNADDMDYLYERDAEKFGDGPRWIDEDALPPRPELDVATFNEMNRPRRGGDLGGLPGAGRDAAEDEEEAR